MFCLAIQTIDNLLTRYADGRLHKGISIAKVKKMTRCMRLLENVSTIVKAGVIMGTFISVLSQTPLSYWLNTLYLLSRILL